MTKKVKILFTVLFLAGNVFSQYMHIPDSVNLIDEVFVIAPKRLSESGLKITGIDSTVMENKAISNMSSLLSENSPVFVRSNGRGSMSTASFRGTNSSHTKILWNNIPLNSPLFGMVDLSLIPTNITDEIFLYHGSASLLKSGGALGGLVDLRTRPSWKNETSVGIISSYGSYSSFSNAVDLSFGNEKIQSVSKIYLINSENDFEFNNTDIFNGGIQKQKNADFYKRGILQEIYYRHNSKSYASIKAWYQDMDRGIPVLTTNQSGFNNNISRQTDENLIISAIYSYEDDSRKIDINSGANVQNMNYNHKNYISGVGLYKVIDSESNVFSIYNSVCYSQKISENIEFSSSAGYNYHKVNSFEIIRNEGYDTVRNEMFLSASLFADITDKFRLGILSRQEVYDKKFSGFIPSIFAEYRFNNNFSLRSSVAGNTKYPNLNELYLSPGGNPDLIHEKGWQYESGIDYTFLSDIISIRSGITGFYSKINDWILWRPTNMGFWQPENIDLVIAKGIEIYSFINLKSGDWNFTGSGNYAYTSSVNHSQAINENDKSIGKQLPYIPLHSANAFIRAEYKGFYFSYQWNYYSERYTGSAAEPGLLVSIYPYFMNDISIGKKLSIYGVKSNIGFFVYNIFNESYRSVLWQPMPGINYRIQLVMNF